ncbi:hypothetical protein QYE76_053730 [Lolium multiflorum]|uniref:Uncharacterized protein n=1 Tax=Lolium multiflorum TaxID=4521 RepID=A0AAD8SXV2_LOLMU|nr:hypothetical protein QYE76_053730 [Lolium multiflorum]
MPLLRPFFSFVLATTGDTVPSGASPATELLERMRSRDLMRALSSGKQQQRLCHARRLSSHYDIVRELLRLDANLLIKLTSLRPIRRLEALPDGAR